MNCSTPGFPVHHQLPAFSRPYKKLCREQPLPVPSFPAQRPLIYFIYKHCLFWISHINAHVKYRMLHICVHMNCIHFAAFCSWLLSSNLFKAHPCYRMSSLSVTKKSPTIWMDTFCSFSPQSMDICSPFQPSGIMALLVIFMHTCSWTYVFNSLGYTPGWSCGNSKLIFWGTAKLFSKAAASFYILTGSGWEFWLPDILDSTCYCPLSLYASRWLWNGLSLWFGFVFS